jgi:dTDP-4-amino-4,6-dideoxygalactose transaminase
MDHARRAGSGPPPQWRVPFVRPDLPPFADVESAFRGIVESGAVTKGGHLRALEVEVSGLIGGVEIVGVSSCSVGLALGLRALLAMQAESGVAGGRNEVIVPSFTFLAAPAAIVWAGLVPVFVEVDPHSWTVSPADVEAAIGPRTAAILACHTFGCPCDMPALESVADRAGIPLMVDAAHGLGSTLAGRQVGSEGFAQVFSMSPTKLVVAGEGGLVATRSRAFAEAIRELREYGNDGHYGCALPGLNGRLPELSAALGRASLARLPEVRQRRVAVAEVYRQALGPAEGIGFQRIPAGAETNWKEFSITVDPERCGVDRDAVRRGLADRGIDTRAYYSPPCHEMAAYGGYPSASRPLPVSRRLAATSLSLPMGGHVTPDVAHSIATDILAIVEDARSGATIP